LSNIKNSLAKFADCHFSSGGATAMSIKKVLLLYSGGLDSILAAKTLQSAGVAVVAVYFVNPFHQNPDPAEVIVSATRLGIELHARHLTEEYLKVVSHPIHGYGKRMNPCLDCRIYQLRLAKQLLPEYDASLLATGEILDQRPNSQRCDALDIVERDAGVRGILLRPLTALHLRPTIPELEGWIDRGKLLDLKGRGRVRQIELAARYGITEYPTPAGGCLLTSEEYSQKVADLLARHSTLTMRMVELLRFGRHLRLTPEVKIIVGKDAAENEHLIKLAGREDFVLETQACAGPITLYCGPEDPAALQLAAAITAGYARTPSGEPATVTAGREGHFKSLIVIPLDRTTIRRYFICRI
jgi:tRNA-specific 2-thiouridylase